MSPQEIFILIVVIIVFLFVISFKSIKSIITGKVGEFKVNLKLKGIPDSVIINDLKFTVNENKTCQIDHVLVCSRGIFVIETKAYAGSIYGNDSQREWTQVLQYGKIKNKMYSPVKQNNTHIYELSKKIGKRDLFNCVVFTKNNIEHIESEYVFTLKSIKKHILKQPKIYSMLEVELIAEEIKNINEDISNRKHVQNIKKMQRNIEKNICPRCGNELVLRTSVNGSFYGCSKYPKCKFKKKI